MLNDSNQNNISNGEDSATDNFVGMPPQGGDDAEDWDGTDLESGPVLNSAGSNSGDEDASGLGRRDFDDPDAPGTGTPKPDMERLTVQHIDEFLSDHQSPSPDELEDMVVNETPETYERLRELADQYDIIVDDGTDAKEIVEKIRQAMDNADDMIY